MAAELEQEIAREDAEAGNQHHHLSAIKEETPSASAQQFAHELAEIARKQVEEDERLMKEQELLRVAAEEAEKKRRLEESAKERKKKEEEVSLFTPPYRPVRLQSFFWLVGSFHLVDPSRLDLDCYL
jgi:hypothetical protein